MCAQVAETPTDPDEIPDIPPDAEPCPPYNVRPGNPAFFKCNALLLPSHDKEKTPNLVRNVALPPALNLMHRPVLAAAKSQTIKRRR